MDVTVTKIRPFGCGPGAYTITWRTPGRWRKSSVLMTIDREIIHARRFLPITADEAVINAVHREVYATLRPRKLQIFIDSKAWRQGDLEAASAELDRYREHPELLPELDEKIVRGPWQDRDVAS